MGSRGPQDHTWAANGTEKWRHFCLDGPIKAPPPVLFRAWERERAQRERQPTSQSRGGGSRERTFQTQRNTSLTRESLAAKPGSRRAAGGQSSARLERPRLNLNAGGGSREPQGGSPVFTPPLTFLASPEMPHCLVVPLLPLASPPASKRVFPKSSG